MALTIRDVALAAGVSTATVSRALRGLSNVDAGTRDRIVAIAREMNFSVSPAASRLATGRTGTIGIVTQFVGSWYFSEVFAGIEEALKPHDVDLLLHTTDPTDPSSGSATQTRMRRRIDGALVIGLAADSAEVQALSTLDLPLVLLGTSGADQSSVSIDDRDGARMAVNHLVDLGHERIGLISGRELPTQILPENYRLAGYLDVLTAKDLSTAHSLREIGLFTTPGGEHAMERLLKGRRPPTAVFCMSDEMAFGALRAITRAGLQAGGDVDAGEIAVIGFDNHDLSDLFGLSTVGQPVREIGRSAADLLMRYVTATAEAEPEVRVIPTTLYARSTTAR
ncbi:LacI family DNA-binding transcriptional regulator [Jatrophihabitans sp. DSM 45814]